MRGALILEHGLVESFVIYLLHPACNPSGCLVERVDAAYRFSSYPDED